MRFNDAFDAAIRLLQQQPIANVGEVVLVRDLFGRLRTVVEKRDEPKGKALKLWDDQFQQALGSYFGGPSMVGSEMVAPEQVFESSDVYSVGGVRVLERGITGAEWTRGTVPNRPPSPPRATFYGMKGGVGRSTALSAWARHLAGLGHKVLVVDLDLESPGISTTLLPNGSAADFGVVDWFVEDAHGNADEDLVRRLAVRSPLSDQIRSDNVPGEILVAPCGAAEDVHYIAKLARCYLELPGQPRRPFGERIGLLIDALEAVHKPDVVLLDSRAGLHDIAGIATARLGAMTFLFGTGSRQTWAGYRTLLRTLARSPENAEEVRGKLKVVAALVPPELRPQYLTRVREGAYDAFEPLYDSEGTFNFDVTSEDAPHFPIPAYSYEEFRDWDPLSATVTDEQIAAAFGVFVTTATKLLMGQNRP